MLSCERRLFLKAEFIIDIQIDRRSSLIDFCYNSLLCLTRIQILFQINRTSLVEGSGGHSRGRSSAANGVALHFQFSTRTPQRKALYGFLDSRYATVCIRSACLKGRNCKVLWRLKCHLWRGLDGIITIACWLGVPSSFTVRETYYLRNLTKLFEAKLFSWKIGGW